jgi:hypothetical protein
MSISPSRPATRTKHRRRRGRRGSRSGARMRAQARRGAHAQEPTARSARPEVSAHASLRLMRRLRRRATREKSRRRVRASIFRRSAATRSTTARANEPCAPRRPTAAGARSRWSGWFPCGGARGRTCGGTAKKPRPRAATRAASRPSASRARAPPSGRCEAQAGALRRSRARARRDRVGRNSKARPEANREARPGASAAKRPARAAAKAPEANVRRSRAVPMTPPRTARGLMRDGARARGQSGSISRSGGRKRRARDRNQVRRVVKSDMARDLRSPAGRSRARADFPAKAAFQARTAAGPRPTHGRAAQPPVFAARIRVLAAKAGQAPGRAAASQEVGQEGLQEADLAASPAKGARAENPEPCASSAAGSRAAR